MEKKLGVVTLEQLGQLPTYPNRPRRTPEPSQREENPLTSAATEAVQPVPNNPAIGQPVITGTPQIGETLTADTSAITNADGLTNVSYSYQWIRNDGGTDTNISGRGHPHRPALQGADLRTAGDRRPAPGRGSSSGPWRKTSTRPCPPASSSSRWCSRTASGGGTRSGIARSRAKRRHGPRAVSLAGGRA